MTLTLLAWFILWAAVFGTIAFILWAMSDRGTDWTPVLIFLGLTAGVALVLWAGYYASGHPLRPAIEQAEGSK